MRADQLLIERRLDEIEALWLEGATRTEMIEYLQSPTSVSGCTLCVQKEAEQCKHGPPRWSNEAGKAIPARTILWYVQKAKARLCETFREQQTKNRILTLGQINRGIARLFRENKLKDLLGFLRFRSELDGTKQAAEEAQVPTLFETVQGKMATCEDYRPGAWKKRKAPLSLAQSRYLLLRLDYLLDEANTSIHEYRKAPKPENDVEARLYLRVQLIEALHQSLIHPSLSPEGKREALQKLGATYAMVSKDSDLAEHLVELKDMLQKIQAGI